MTLERFLPWAIRPMPVFLSLAELASTAGQYRSGSRRSSVLPIDHYPTEWVVLLSSITKPNWLLRTKPSGKSTRTSGNKCRKKMGAVRKAKPPVAVDPPYPLCLGKDHRWVQTQRIKRRTRDTVTYVCKFCQHLIILDVKPLFARGRTPSRARAQRTIFTE